MSANRSKWRDLNSVLVVEDNPVVRGLISKTLTMNGYEVSQAASGEEALAICASYRPDIVIVDDGLPGIKGDEVARILGSDLNIPFMVITAYSDRKTLDRYIALGASNYLVKPVSPESLVAAINSAYNNARNIKNLLLKSSRDHYIGRAVACLMLLKGYTEERAIKSLKSEARSERKKLWIKAQEVFEHSLQNQRQS